MRSSTLGYFRHQVRPPSYEHRSTTDTGLQNTMATVTENFLLFEPNAAFCSCDLNIFSADFCNFDGSESPFLHEGKSHLKGIYIGSVSNYFSPSHNCVALSSRSAVVDNVHVNYFKMLLKPNRPKKLELLLWINFKGSMGPFHEKWENVGHSHFKDPATLSPLPE